MTTQISAQHKQRHRINVIHWMSFELTKLKAKLFKHDNRQQEQSSLNAKYMRDKLHKLTSINKLYLVYKFSHKPLQIQVCDRFCILQTV